MTQTQINTIKGFQRQIESINMQIKNYANNKKNLSSNFSIRIKSAKDSTQRKELNKQKKMQIESISKDIQARKFDLAQLRKQLISYRLSIKK